MNDKIINSIYLKMLNQENIDSSSSSDISILSSIADQCPLFWRSCRLQCSKYYQLILSNQASNIVRVELNDIKKVELFNIVGVLLIEKELFNTQKFVELTLDRIPI